MSEQMQLDKNIQEIVVKRNEEKDQFQQDTEKNMEKQRKRFEEAQRAEQYAREQRQKQEEASQSAALSEEQLKAELENGRKVVMVNMPPMYKNR